MSASLNDERKPLRAEFRKLLTERRAWPSGPRFFKWVRDDRGEKIKSLTYTKMRQGNAVPIRLIQLLIQYQLHASPDPAETQRRRSAFHSVLMRLGHSDPFSLSLDKLVEAVVDDDDDAMQGGHLALAKACNELPDHCVQANATLDEIHESMEWMYIQLGRMAAGDDPTIPDEAAITTAEAMIGITLDDYRRRALKWQGHAEWSVVPVRTSNRLIGAAIVLPLKESTYEQVRSGLIMASDIKPRDLQVPSRFLFLEAAMDRPAGPPQSAYHLTPFLVLTLDTQVSRLCHVSQPFHQPLCILSRVATPRNERRLKSFSFEYTGTVEAKTGLPLMQLRLDAYDRGDKRLLRALLTMLAEQVVEPPAELTTS